MRRVALAGCMPIGLFGLRLSSKALLAADEKSAGGKKALIERGRYLVTVGGCNDCHTPRR